MAEPNGVTRREFDKLEGKVELIIKEGTPQGAARSALLASKIDEVHQDLVELRQTVDRRLSNLFRVGGSIGLVLFTGLITLIVALIGRIFE